MIHYFGIHESNKEYLEKDEKTPLYAAVDQENIEIIETLVQNANIDINQYSTFISKKENIETKRTALHLSVIKENIK